MSKKPETQATLLKPAVKQARAKVLPPVEAPRKISSLSVLRLARDYRRGKSPDGLRESFSLLDWKGKWYVLNVLLAEVFNEGTGQDGMFLVANFMRQRGLAFNCLAARDCQRVAKIPINILAQHGGYGAGIVRVIGMAEENGSFQPGKARLIYRFSLEDLKNLLSFLEDNKDGNSSYGEAIKTLTKHIRMVEEFRTLRQFQDSR